LQQVAPVSSTVEVIVLSAVDGRLRYRALRRPLDAGVHPDDLARGLAELTACTPGAVLHSTSWRFAAGGVVLTYAALPDPHSAAQTQPVALDAMVGGAGPLAPSPAALDLDAVAAHACRHLALLVTVDDDVALAARELPELWELVAKLPPALAGQLRDPAAGQPRALPALPA
jgi:hypothetical protein